MAAVSIRYAEALLGSASDKNKTLKNLKIIAELYLANYEFKETINNPRIDNNTKVDIIREIIEADEVFVNFIDLVLHEGRFNLIDDIYKKFLNLVNEIDKVISIVIVSAYELSSEEALAIASKYKKLYDASEVKYEIKIDSSLIGGVKVICGDKIYDDTIRTKLNEIL